MSISSSLLGNEAIAAAIKSGNINIAGAMEVEVMELSNESKDAQMLHAEILRKYESQKRGRTIVVPTSIEDVKCKLRELGRPITLFGEGHADRRERLRDVIANLEIGEEEIAKIQGIINQSTLPTIPSAGTSGAESKQNQKEVFYSPANDELIASRKLLFDFSFRRSQKRLSDVRKITENSELQAENDRYVSSLYTACKDMTLNSSQFGDDRPLSCVRYNPNGSQVASGSLSSYIKIWDVSNLACISTLHSHEERITSLSWCPQSSGGKSLLASSSADGTCKIWDCSQLLSNPELDGQMDVEYDNSIKNENMGNEKKCDIKIEKNNESKNDVKERKTNGGNHSKSNILHTLRGHQGVVNDCEYHPNGLLLGTASSDYTWRLWDTETGRELLLQDGHIKDCTAISFQLDGSLVLTADAAGVALLWDLRSGQQIQSFKGHVKKITSITFNPNGFQVATGSIDNMVRIWDLRKRKCSYCLPAHSNLISDIKYSKSGEMLLTSSFDGSLKIWGSRDFQLLRSLSGHLGKVMSCDFSPSDERHIISAGFDRTLKLWAHKDEF